MKHIIFRAFLLAGLILSLPGGARAAEQTVTLKIDMWCPSCPYMVKRTLADLNGVKEVTTSYEKQIAVVRFDNELTGVSALTQATADLGFPSTVMSPDGDLETNPFAK